MEVLVLADAKEQQLSYLKFYIHFEYELVMFVQM